MRAQDLRINQKDIYSQLMALSQLRVTAERKLTHHQAFDKGREQAVRNYITQQVRTSANFSLLRQALVLAAKGDLAQANRIFNKLGNVPPTIKDSLNKLLQKQQQKNNTNNNNQKPDLTSAAGIQFSIQNGTDNPLFQFALEEEAENQLEVEKLQKWLDEEKNRLEDPNSEEEEQEKELDEDEEESNENSSPEESRDSEIFATAKSEEAFATFEAIQSGKSETGFAEFCKNMVHGAEEAGVEIGLHSSPSLSHTAMGG